MRPLLILALVTLSLTPTSSASLIRFEQVTVANTAIGFTATAITPAGLNQATVATCRLETAQIRWRIDGTAPTTTVGMPLEIGDTIRLDGQDVLQAFRAIRTTATSGVLNCHYTAP